MASHPEPTSILAAILTLKHLTSDQCININGLKKNPTHSSPLLSPLTQTLSRAAKMHKARVKKGKKEIPIGAAGHRSQYLIDANDALYHLSYSPNTIPKCVVLIIVM